MTSMSSPPTVPALSTTLTARIRALDLTKLPYCTSDKYLTTTALKQAFKNFINNLALLELACDHGEKMISLVLNSTFHHLVDTIRTPYQCIGGADQQTDYLQLVIERQKAEIARLEATAMQQEDKLTVLQNEKDKLWTRKEEELMVLRLQGEANLSRLDKGIDRKVDEASREISQLRDDKNREIANLRREMEAEIDVLRDEVAEVLYRREVEGVRMRRRMEELRTAKDVELGSERERLTTMWAERDGMRVAMEAQLLELRRLKDSEIASLRDKMAKTQADKDAEISQVGRRMAAEVSSLRGQVSVLQGAVSQLAAEKKMIEELESARRKKSQVIDPMSTPVTDTDTV